jgi:hypothetical protein
MNDRWQEDSGMIPAAQLKARLRVLNRIEPPGGLKDKLVAAVPLGATPQISKTVVPPWLRALRYVGVAAAIVVVTAVVVQFLSPSAGPPRLSADINDRSGAAALVDHNNSLPRDINVCDNNAVP